MSNRIKELEALIYKECDVLVDDIMRDDVQSIIEFGDMTTAGFYVRCEHRDNFKALLTALEIEKSKEYTKKLISLAKSSTTSTSSVDDFANARNIRILSCTVETIIL